MNYWRLLKKPFFGRYRVEWQWGKAYGDISLWDRVEFKSRSGAMIRGVYGAALSGDIRGNIVCAHPMVTSAKGFFIRNGHAMMLRNSGFNILLFDFNGFGESEDGDYNLPADILAAGHFMNEKSPGYRTGFYGISFGAAMGVCACADENQPYRSAFFESAFTTLDEFWSRYPFPHFIIKYGSYIFPGQAYEMRPIEKIRKVTSLAAIQWVSGDADDLIPVEMGHRFKNASPVPSDYWIVPGAEHTVCYQAAGRDFEKRIISFFNETLS